MHRFNQRIVTVTKCGLKYVFDMFVMLCNCVSNASFFGPILIGMMSSLGISRNVENILVRNANFLRLVLKF